MRDYCFIVSSAIITTHTKMISNNHLNLFDSKVRFNQTLETIKSIKDRVDCDIYIVESSPSELPSEQLEELNKHATVFHYTSKLSEKIYKTITRVGKLQNSIETLALLNFLESNKEVLSNYKRVFKISGRYKLNDNFNLVYHNNSHVVGKFLFVNSQIKVFQCRLYSFDSSLIEYHIELYNKFLEYMTEVGNNTEHFVDMETCFYKFIDRNYLMLTRTIGVEGFIANNGEFIKE